MTDRSSDQGIASKSVSARGSTEPSAEDLSGVDFSHLTIDLGFPGPVACSAAGITSRQLDYWSKTGVVVPEVAAGSTPHYSARNILILKVIKQLIEAGVPLQHVRPAIEHLKAQGVADLTEVTLMSDGTTVYEFTSDEEVADLLRSGQGVFGIALGAVWRDLEVVLSELPAERASRLDSRSGHGAPRSGPTESAGDSDAGAGSEGRRARSPGGRSGAV